MNLFSTSRPSTAPHRHFQLTLNTPVLVIYFPRILRISYSEELTGPLRDLLPPGMSDMTYITAQVVKLPMIPRSSSPLHQNFHSPPISSLEKSDPRHTASLGRPFLICIIKYGQFSSLAIDMFCKASENSQVSEC